MTSIIAKLNQSLRVKREAEKTYRALQRHLDSFPVGYPATLTGVEIRLLRMMFSVEEAELGLHLSWRHETLDEILQRLGDRGYTRERLQKLLDSMDAKGSVFATESGNERRYALHPFVIGMYEMQAKRLTPDMYLDTRDYVLQRYSVEYFGSEVRQMRVIPVHKSITPQLAVAPYDDIREIVDRTADRIMVTDCICKTGKDMVGKPCKVTDRREVCIGFRDFHDIYKRHGWGRAITKDEALKLLDQNEKEGLVLMPSTAQEPQFVCSCCGCCCGIMEMVSMLPRSADFVESNYRAVLNPDTCEECGRCEKRCQMQAIRRQDKKAVSIDEKRCIGCGLCVSTCKSGSLKLVRKEEQFVPPKDLDDLHDVITKNRKSKAGKLATTAKAMLGFKA
jgi:electron transport complex protein RnfB